MSSLISTRKESERRCQSSPPLQQQQQQNPLHPHANASSSEPLQKAWVRNGRVGLKPLTSNFAQAEVLGIPRKPRA